MLFPIRALLNRPQKFIRDIFGEAVIEHHSNLDPEKENLKAGLLLKIGTLRLLLRLMFNFLNHYLLHAQVR